MFPINQVLQGDCTRVLRTLPNEVVNLVLTDPPYGVRYQDGFGGDRGRFGSLGFASFARSATRWRGLEGYVAWTIRGRDALRRSRSTLSLHFSNVQKSFPTIFVEPPTAASLAVRTF